MTTKDTDTHNLMPAAEPLALRLSEGLGAWLPIVTAPKDKELLLWVGIVVGPPLVKQGRWFRIDNNEKGWSDTDGRVVNATHWMPIPAPPQSA
jgi:hypothetical protein